MGCARLHGRPAVLRARGQRRQEGDHAYFAAIWEQMDAGGYEAMLHDLLDDQPRHLQRARRAGHRGLAAAEEALLPHRRGVVARLP